MKKPFYKTTVRVEVLSEGPFDYNDLSDIHEAITTGECSGSYNTSSVKSLTAAQAARELTKQGSDPQFFGLDGNGRTIR